MDVTKTMVTGMTENSRLAMGTRGYMASELLDGEEATAASDVYSLGVAFFRLLTNVWYDPCLAPKADGESSVGMNSVKLLEPFEYRWVDVLPAMLEDNPAKRPLDLLSLPARVLPPPPKAEPSGVKRSRFKMAVAALIAIVTVFAVWLCLSVDENAVRTDDLYDIPSSAPEIK